LIVTVDRWDDAGEMQLMRRFWDAAVALDPAGSIHLIARAWAVRGRTPGRPR
jgi:hypothetical protein